MMSDPVPPARHCITLVTHVLNPVIRASFDRLRAEVTAGYDIRLALSTDDPLAELAGLREDEIERVSVEQIFRLPYPTKCQLEDWQMFGNLDLVFLEIYRRHDHYDYYWFVEYDVYWQGNWSVFFNYFSRSTADLLAATIHPVDDVPHKAEFHYPKQFVPEGMVWDRPKIMKAFLPICRLSRGALDALDGAYRAGLGGNYEINVPSVVAQHGQVLEDFGGDGAFVRPENLNRFYFAHGETFSHSPGTFVFRPVQRPMRRQNTLWHPVKPEGVPHWFPLTFHGNVRMEIVEWVKPFVGRFWIWLWFMTRWRPLPPQPDTPPPDPRAS